jgi:putative IMPACT (imprinted ancient) family translation regulator
MAFFFQEKSKKDKRQGVPMKKKAKAKKFWDAYKKKHPAKT